jgi:3-oxoacyl-[acyl-carrier-protein] synthase-3
MTGEGTGTISAQITAIATHVPDTVLTNDELAAVFPSWTSDKIFEKTGILERRVAGVDETAGDLAAAAAAALFDRLPEARARVDFLIFCSQAPDYILPTTACVLQDRLGLATQIGALDINLGCSGFVYGLSLACGLIAGGMAKSVLLLTADTYSKYINHGDKSVRTLFGDGAAATLIEADTTGRAAIGPFVFGTDGSGAKDLIVRAGGFRTPRSTTTGMARDDGAGNVRAEDDLFMHGGNVMNFSLREVPRAVGELLALTGTTLDDHDAVVFHQANKFMLDALQRKLGLPASKVPRRYEAIGNTVSSTIPFVLEEALAQGACSQGRSMLLIGFGVGLSWAGARIRF